MAQPVAPVEGRERSLKNLRPWQPGQTGNPSGLPKAAHEIRKLAREHGPWVIERLRELAADNDGRVAVLACKELLDRGYGKPSDELAREQPRALFDLTKLSPEDVETLKALRQKMQVAEATETIDAVAVRHDEPDPHSG